jgi:hypothetical protein
MSNREVASELVKIVAWFEKGGTREDRPGTAQSANALEGRGYWGVIAR